MSQSADEVEIEIEKVVLLNPADRLPFYISRKENVRDFSAVRIESPTDV